ncbi:hypothetical protein [Kitasatospora sp. NPDC001175]|uniref:hypothetical protein n=1 Tax=Kitasatospora sp. NPDC001175 TaxID=3157103 RepID=UPI003D03BCAD
MRACDSQSRVETTSYIAYKASRLMVVSAMFVAGQAWFCRWVGLLLDVLAQGRIAVSRLRVALAGLDLPRRTDRQLSIALDVTPWPRPDAECSPQRGRRCPAGGVRAAAIVWNTR